MSALVTPEFYAFADTTVATGGYTAGSGVLNVASTGGSFSATQQFRVLIADQTTGQVKAILKVTALNSGTQWGVTSDGLDANAVVGDLVQLALTAGAMDQIRADMVRRDTGALPTVAKKGDVFYSDDDGIILRHDGSAFVTIGKYFPHLANPQLQSFAWRNQGGASLVTTPASEAITIPGSSSGYRGREVSAPGTPYTLTACIIPQMYSGSGAGIYFTDGTKCVLFVVTSNFLTVAKFDTITTFNSGYGTKNLYAVQGPLHLRITDDGTNRIFSWSLDGVNFLQHLSVGRTDFLTATGIGYCVEGASDPASVQLVGWKVV